jgi:hypothetical protein
MHVERMTRIAQLFLFAVAAVVFAGYAQAITILLTNSWSWARRIYAG